MPAQRQRRSSAEVRSLLLTAARECFAAKGFGGATTRQIADQAGVVEAALFRHFPTKRALFESAVLEPFEEFLTRYTAAWKAVQLDRSTPERILRQYAAELYDLVRQHRDLFAALMAYGLESDELATALARLDAMGDSIAEAHGLRYDTAVYVRSAFMMVVATAVHEDALFRGVDASRARIVIGLSEILVAAARLGDAPKD
jgi:AcrR family transcriptional regulator